MGHSPVYGTVDKGSSGADARGEGGGGYFDQILYFAGFFFLQSVF